MRRRTFTLSQLIAAVTGVSVVASLSFKVDWAPSRGCDFTPTLVAQTAEQIDLYKLKKGRLPRSLGELVPEHAKETPTDLWGRRLIYVTDPSLPDGYRVGSYGADGRAGGEGEDADLWSDDFR